MNAVTMIERRSGKAPRLASTSTPTPVASPAEREAS